MPNEHNSILVEQAIVVGHELHPAKQHILQLHCPRITARAHPGSFVHVECGRDHLLRRPMSIMSAALETGQIEILFKAVGTGTASLARLQVDDTVSLIGPIGNQFVPHRQYPIRFLLGGGVGIPPMIFLAQQLKSQKLPVPYAFMGSEIPFPFTCAPTNLPVPGLDQPQFLAIEALQSLGIPNRLASLADLPGTFNGLVTDLAETVIKALSAQQRKQVELFACGPTPMLAAVAALARRYQMPCQVSLEEYMACAVGGCAGCVVEVSLPDGPAMKRVCVDGPIFAASEAFPAKPFSDPIEPVFE